MKLKSQFRPRHLPFLCLAVVVLTLLLVAPASAAAAPTVTGVNLGYGSTAAGQLVTITGTGFTAGGIVNIVTFGGTAGTNLLVTNDTTLTVMTPAHVAGAANVTVTRQPRPAGDGKSDTLRNGFTYLDAPTLTNVAPGTRAYPAGAAVTITGTSFFAGLTSVTFNGVAGTGVAVTSFSRLVVTVPKVNPGPVTVAVTTAGYGTATRSDLFAVTPKNLTISGAVAVDKIYDGNTIAPVHFTGATLSGVVFGDSVGVNSVGYSANFANKNAGNHKAVTVAGVVLSGAQAGNYTLTQPTGLTANITPVTISADWGVDSKEYDGTRNADAIYRNLYGVLDEDQVALARGRATFDDPYPGEGKTVTLRGARLTGADAVNYRLAPIGTTTGSIDRRSLTATFGVDSKEYDGTTGNVDVINMTLDRVLPSDDVSLAYDSAAWADKNAGLQTVDVIGAHVVGADIGNYRLDFVNPVTGMIDQRSLTATFVVDSKEYDGTTGNVDVINMTLDRVLPSDDVSLAYDSAAWADKNAGLQTVDVIGAHLIGADIGNYRLDFVNPVTGMIDKRSLTGTATADDKTYDGLTDAVAHVSSDGVLSGDSVIFSYAAANFDDPEIGESKTVTVTGISLGGTDGGNYSLLNTTATAIATIKAP